MKINWMSVLSIAVLNATFITVCSKANAQYGALQNAPFRTPLSGVTYRGNTSGTCLVAFSTGGAFLKFGGEMKGNATWHGGITATRPAASPTDQPQVAPWYFATEETDKPNYAGQATLNVPVGEYSQVFDIACHGTAVYKIPRTSDAYTGLGKSFGFYTVPGNPNQQAFTTFQVTFTVAPYQD